MSANQQGFFCAYQKKLLLNNGVSMPAVGISTYRARSESIVYQLIDSALDSDYRLFDTSSLFCNEVALRNAFASLLPKYRLERKDIFISSKLVALNEGATVRSSFESTLSNLGLDYIDMYLLSSSLSSSIDLKEAWEELKLIYEAGATTAIGVANFTVHQLYHIMEDSTTPSVNQVEWHPMNSSETLYSFCLENSITLQAYAPFGTPFARRKTLFYNRHVRKLSAKYEIPPSQVLLMWTLQQNVGVLPSSLNPEHMTENIHFELLLEPREMAKLGTIAPNSDDSDAPI